MIVHIMGDLHALQGGVCPGDASRCWVVSVTALADAVIQPVCVCVCAVCMGQPRVMSDE